jgi:NADH:quinone reductase (non-electrogenic)
LVVPGLAQVAMQQGRYAVKLIHNRIVGKPASFAFNCFDKGSMAVVGKGFAVLQSGKVRISGFGLGPQCTFNFSPHRASV